MLSHARLIAFSGIDGGGKTTQIEFLERTLLKLGFKSYRFWARGGYTPGFMLLKRVARSFRSGALPPPGRSAERDHKFKSVKLRRLWLTIALADLFICYSILIRWYLARGYVVICDRYIDDTELDFKLNFKNDHVENWFLWKLLRRCVPRPEVSFLFLIPCEESMLRSKLKCEPFPDSPTVIQQRLNEYKTWTGHHAWSLMDGLESRDLLHQKVCRMCGFADPLSPRTPSVP